MHIHQHEKALVSLSRGPLVMTELVDMPVWLVGTYNIHMDVSSLYIYIYMCLRVYVFLYVRVYTFTVRVCVRGAGILKRKER